jgi:hypothetical protein
MKVIFKDKRYLKYNLYKAKIYGAAKENDLKKSTFVHPCDFLSIHVTFFLQVGQTIRNVSK